MKHRGEARLLLRFPYDQVLLPVIKKLSDVKYSATHCCWHVPDKPETINELLKVFKGKAWIDYSKLTLRHKPEDLIENTEDSNISSECVAVEIKKGLYDFKMWLQHKRYSESTIKTYLDAAKSFLMFIYPKPLPEVDNNDMVRYVTEYIIKNKLSFAYQNQVINATKLFFREVVKSKLIVDKLERPRREHKLPNVLSKEEVVQILKALKNLKHKVMLSLIYSCGLRRSELLNLKPADIDSKRNLLIIRSAKGYKDRVAPLSDKIIEMLRTYYKAYKPAIWLFEGWKKGEKYSAESLSHVLKNALTLTKIKKPVSLHWLRHSYATHLLESGTDLRYIQEILGHKSSRTTEIYTHVSNKNLQKIKSPFDDLDID